MGSLPWCWWLLGQEHKLLPRERRDSTVLALQVLTLGWFLSPGVECLGLRDRPAAWRLFPLLTLSAEAAERVFREPGASPRLWEGLFTELDFTAVGDSELRLGGGHCTEWWVLAQSNDLAIPAAHLLGEQPRQLLSPGQC